MKTILNKTTISNLIIASVSDELTATRQDGSQIGYVVVKFRDKSNPFAQVEYTRSIFQREKLNKETGEYDAYWVVSPAELKKLEGTSATAIGCQIIAEAVKPYTFKDRQGNERTASMFTTVLFKHECSNEDTVKAAFRRLKRPLVDDVDTPAVETVVVEQNAGEVTEEAPAAPANLRS